MSITCSCTDAAGISIISSRSLMLRSWFLWLTLLLAAVSVGWFWLLAQDLRFARLEPDPPAAAADKGG